MAGKRNDVKTIKTLHDQIQKKVEEIASVADDIPSVIIIHNLQKNFMIEYMSSIGRQQLGLSLEELKKFSAEEYHQRFFNPEDAKDYVPKLKALMENNTDESISFFQQVRISAHADWVWHLSSIKILMRDHDGTPVLTITHATPIDPQHHLTTKVSRLLEENNFLRKNYHLFAQLGKREQEVLKLLALGKSSNEIAEELFIAPSTADTHRRNIKQKLNINSVFEISQYARAFDLI